MSAAKAVPETSGVDEFETANDRFKKSFGSWFWGSMIVATVLHFALFAFWPEMQAEDFSFTQDELQTIDLPPEIEIPPPPERIARPATPVMAEADLDEDITIAPTTFEDNPVEDLPPPPEEGGENLAAGPTFTPYTVKPELKNSSEVQRALEREYPPLLRDAGVGGTAVVWFFIDENGRVLDTQVAQSSGHASLDQAALDVAEIMEFTPALNRDQRVKVWVQFPITFQVR